MDRNSISSNHHIWAIFWLKIHVSKAELLIVDEITWILIIVALRLVWYKNVLQGITLFLIYLSSTYSLFSMYTTLSGHYHSLILFVEMYFYIYWFSDYDELRMIIIFSTCKVSDDYVPITLKSRVTTPYLFLTQVNFLTWDSPYWANYAPNLFLIISYNGPGGGNTGLYGVFLCRCAFIF